MNTLAKPPLATTYEAREGVLSAPLDDEVVLLHLESGVYFGLNEVAAFVWSQLPSSGAALVDAVVEAFEADRERIAGDVDALLQDLVSRDLLRVSETSSA